MKKKRKEKKGIIQKKKIREGTIKSHLVKTTKTNTNLTSLYFILVTFWKCLFSMFSSFNDKKLKVQVLQ